MFKYNDIQNLNKTEYKIFKYCVENADKIVHMNIRDLSDEVYVSTATIVRMCRKLQCKGFNDFKENLNEYLKGEFVENPEPEIEHLKESLDNYKLIEFKRVLEEFDHYITKDKLLLFVGAGQSGSIASYAARYFSNFGYFSLSIEDSFYPTPDIDKSYILFILSSSGETKEIVDMMYKYKKIKTPILSLTTDINSTIARNSDVTYAYQTLPLLLPNMLNVTSQVLVVYIIERLAKLKEIEYVKQNNQYEETPKK